VDVLAAYAQAHEQRVPGPERHLVLVRALSAGTSAALHVADGLAMKLAAIHGRQARVRAEAA
jgi:hypothetical protein